MNPHSIVIGYGSTGRYAARTIAENGTGAEITVIDIDPTRTTLARNDGTHTIRGNAGDPEVLRRAGTGRATSVTIAVGADSEAVRITSAVRGLNDRATICTSLRATGWRGVAEYLGADQVVVSGTLAGRLLGLSARRPAVLAEFQRTLRTRPEWVVAQRPVRANEIGRLPARCGPLVLAVLRGNRLCWRDDPDTAPLRAPDRLMVLRTAARQE